MGRFLRSAKFYWLACLFVLAILGFTQRDAVILIDPFASISHFLDGISGLNDPQSFATAAQDIYATGQVSEANKWIIHLWPPGFILFEVGILKVFGFDAPLTLILQIFAFCSAAFMMTVQRTVLSPYIGRRLASVAPFTLFLFPVARYFLLQPIWVVYGETFSVSFFLSGVLLLLLSAQRQRLGYAVLAGVLFAAAAYFRSQYELLVLSMTCLAVPLVLGCLWRLRTAPGEKEKGMATRTTLIVLTALATAHVVMFPWRLHNHQAGFGWSWVQTSSIVVYNGLSSDQDLKARGGNFVIAGGGNIACKVSPEDCGKNDAKLFFKAFFQPPLEWYAWKLEVIPKFLSPFSAASLFKGNAYAVQELISDYVIVLLMLLTLPLIWICRKREWILLVAWPVVSFCGAYAAIITFAQLETRYFYLPKLFAVLIFIQLASLARSRWKARAPATHSSLDTASA